MALVIDFDQRHSSANPDLIAPFLDELNTAYGAALELPFVRTAGDEMQALLRSPEALAPILALAFARGAWWAGVGIGHIDRRGVTARESAGPAFKAARVAVDAAKRDRRSPGPVAVRGTPEQCAGWLQASLGALAFIIEKRTPRQREIVDAVRVAGSQQAAATTLRIAAQTVSKSLVAGGYDQEIQLSELVSDLARSVVDAR